ncbi:hypothetical protein MRB53_015430 [Persea americana]|uniref:Uncharacterized protein n=1 Tax=Persea americana TaxID=3435 RepID=A0ACC2KE60_PERAE|nr:hypothetical protein MRB53_015430 [Persea americana]
MSELRRTYQQQQKTQTIYRQEITQAGHIGWATLEFTLNRDAIVYVSEAQNQADLTEWASTLPRILGDPSVEVYDRSTRVALGNARL